MILATTGRQPMRLQRKKENALHGVVTEFNRVMRVVARRVEKLKRRQLEELKAARAAEPAIPANSKPKKDKKENRHGIERRGKMWRGWGYDRTTRGAPGPGGAPQEEGGEARG